MHDPNDSSNVLYKSKLIPRRPAPHRRWRWTYAYCELRPTPFDPARARSTVDRASASGG
jgi:hypothetical protein